MDQPDLEEACQTLRETQFTDAKQKLHALLRPLTCETTSLV